MRFPVKENAIVSDEERVHGTTFFGIVWEILLVLSMFLQGPNAHLHRREHKEDISAKDLSHDGKDEPSHGFPEVVGAADE